MSEFKGMQQRQFQMSRQLLLGFLEEAYCFAVWVLEHLWLSLILQSMSLSLSGLPGLCFDFAQLLFYCLYILKPEVQ